MVMAMLVMLVALSRVPGWLVVLVLREKCPLMACLRPRGRGLILLRPTWKDQDGVAARRRHVSLGSLSLQVYFLGLHEAVVDFNLVGLWTLLLATIVSLISAGQYIKGFLMLWTIAAKRRRRLRSSTRDTDILVIGRSPV